MKLLLRITLALLMAACIPAFQSCGEGSTEPNLGTESKIPATASEIQGRWSGTLSGYYYTFNFDGSEYTYGKMDISSDKIVQRSTGTFSISGGRITFKPTVGTVEFNGNEIFWTHSFKNTPAIGSQLRLLKMP